VFFATVVHIVKIDDAGESHTKSATDGLISPEDPSLRADKIDDVDRSHTKSATDGLISPEDPSLRANKIGDVDESHTKSATDGLISPEDPSLHSSMQINNICVARGSPSAGATNLSLGRYSARSPSSGAINRPYDMTVRFAFCTRERWLKHVDINTYFPIKLCHV
jgi:hypothetical protein